MYIFIWQPEVITWSSGCAKNPVHFINTSPSTCPHWPCQGVVALPSHRVHHSKLEAASKTEPLDYVEVLLAHSEQAKSIRQDVEFRDQNLLWFLCSVVVDPYCSLWNHPIPAHRHLNGQVVQNFIFITVFEKVRTLLCILAPSVTLVIQNEQFKPI